MPDFRSPGGIWTKYAPVSFQEFQQCEEARVRSWQRKKVTHEFMKNAQPNTGHFFIHSLDQRGKLLGLITQNVDGLHSRAGLPEEKIVELHGTDRKVVCLKCGKFFDTDEVLKNLVGEFRSPTCDECGGILKGATVSFGQSMPQREMQRAGDFCQSAQIFIVLGSSLLVQPAASFPVIAKQNNALLAIINRDETHLDPLADFIHRGQIGDFCRQLGKLTADG